MDHADENEARSAVPTLEQSRPRERSRWACVACRQRKVRCDGAHPVCSHCRRREKDCIYPHGRRRAQVQRPSGQDLRQRVEQVERLVHQAVHDKAHQSLTASYTPTPKSPGLRCRAERSGSGGAETASTSNYAVVASYPKSSLARYEDEELNLCDWSGCILSPTICSWINSMMGDERFTQTQLRVNIPRTLYRKYSQGEGDYPLPADELLWDLFENFRKPLNVNIPVFADEQLVGLRQHYLGGMGGGAACYSALNIICAIAIYTKSGMQSAQSEELFSNALHSIPRLLVSKSDVVSAGSIMAMVLYLMLTSRNQLAATILGFGVQKVLAIGRDRYNTPNSTDAEQHRRLSWLAYVMDQDISMRLGKAPAVPDYFGNTLPDEAPVDGVGNFTLRNGSVVNFLREEVALAQIQNKIFHLLRTPSNITDPSEQVFEKICDLQEELQSWKRRVPDIMGPQCLPGSSDHSALMCLTSLQATYLQLNIAIHAAVLLNPSLLVHPTYKDRANQSMAACTDFARVSISLLQQHNLRHPFVIYLLDHVAWAADVLFLQILLHQGARSSSGDLDLLRSIIEFYERYDCNCNSATSYVAVRALYSISREILAQKFSPGSNLAEPMPTSTPVQSGPSEEAQGSGLRSVGFETPVATPLAVLDRSLKWSYAANKIDWQRWKQSESGWWKDPWRQIFSS